MGFALVRVMTRFFLTTALLFPATVGAQPPADADPALGPWFRSLLVPGTSISCCSAGAGLPYRLTRSCNALITRPATRWCAGRRSGGSCASCGLPNPERRRAGATIAGSVERQAAGNPVTRGYRRGLGV